LTYSSDYTRLFEGEITCLPWRRLTDDNVIQKINAQDNCGFFDLASQPEVGLGWRWVPRGMVMYERKGESGMILEEGVTETLGVRSGR
jgi:hypothetical protein